MADFKARNKSLTAKLLRQGYRYHKLRKTISKFYRRHYELVSKFNVGLKTLLHQGLSESKSYDDVVYKFKLLSIYVLSCFPLGFEGRMWDLIVSVPEHCLSFYFMSRQINPNTCNLKVIHYNLEKCISKVMRYFCSSVCFMLYMQCICPQFCCVLTWFYVKNM